MIKITNERGHQEDGVVAYGTDLHCEYIKNISTWRAIISKILTGNWQNDSHTTKASLRQGGESELKMAPVADQFPMTAPAHAQPNSNSYTTTD